LNQFITIQCCNRMSLTMRGNRSVFLHCDSLIVIADDF
jgi:hypothetical protein